MRIGIPRYLTKCLDIARQRSGRPLRYLLAAGSNLVLGLTVYPALLWLFPFFRVHYMISLLIAQVVCTSIAFVTYKFLVFKTSGRVLKEFWAFLTFYLLNYVVNWVCLPVLVEVVGLSPITAQWIFVAIVGVSSYFWHSRISFGRTE